MICEACGKICYPDHAAAVRAARGIRSRTRRRAHVYQCGDNPRGPWHPSKRTSHDERELRRRRQRRMREAMRAGAAAALVLFVGAVILFGATQTAFAQSSGSELLPAGTGTTQRPAPIEHQLSPRSRAGAASPGAAATLFNPPLARASADANGDGFAGFSTPFDAVPLRVAAFATFREWQHAAGFLQFDGFADAARLDVARVRVVAHGWLSLGAAFDAGASSGVLGELGARLALCGDDYANGGWVEFGKGHNADWFIGFGARGRWTFGDDGQFAFGLAFTPRLLLGRDFERWRDKRVTLGQPLIDVRVEWRFAELRSGEHVSLAVGWSYWPDVQDERALRADGREDPAALFGVAFARLASWTTFYLALEWRLR